jgi:hypothetical protein
METKLDIEEQINKALNSVKNMEPVELPFGFPDKVMNKLHSRKDNVRSLYTFPSLLKVAAMITIVLVNVYTLKLALTSSNSPLPAAPGQYTSINDFVSDYGINDANYEVVTINKPAHE